MTRRKTNSATLEAQIAELKAKLLGKEELSEIEEEEEEEEPKPRKNKKRVEKRIIKPKKKKVVYIEESESSEESSSEEEEIITRIVKKNKKKKKQSLVERSIAKPEPAPEPLPAIPQQSSYKSYLPGFHNF